MRRTIKHIALTLVLSVALFSCNQGETLQSYFVNNQETPNFLSVDIPTSFVNVDQTALTEEQKEAYDSVDKLNMLAYSLDSANVEGYKIELAKVQSILKNEKYEELMSGASGSIGKFTVKYIGTDTAIDELIVFGSSEDKGFAVVRVLGDNMEPAKLMTLGSVLQNADPEMTDVSSILEFFN